MDVKVNISRTFQAQQFCPVKIEIEIIQKNVEDYDSAYEAASTLIGTSLIKEEVRLRELYQDGNEKVYDEKVDEDKPKRKLRRNS